jgi:hypothetical protein
MWSNAFDRCSSYCCLPLLGRRKRTGGTHTRRETFGRPSGPSRSDSNAGNEGRIVGLAADEEPPCRRHNASLSSPPLFAGPCTRSDFGSILGSPRAAVHDKLSATKLKLMSDTPSSDQIEVEARTTRQHLPVLIFDELEYEPFTENRRWPSGKMKIARLGPSATPANWKHCTLARRASARACGRGPGACHNILI